MFCILPILSPLLAALSTSICANLPKFSAGKGRRNHYSSSGACLNPSCFAHHLNLLLIGIAQPIKTNGIQFWINLLPVGFSTQQAVLHQPTLQIPNFARESQSVRITWPPLSQPFCARSLRNIYIICHNHQHTLTSRKTEDNNPNHRATFWQTASPVHMESCRFESSRPEKGCVISSCFRFCQLVSTVFRPRSLSMTACESASKSFG